MAGKEEKSDGTLDTKEQVNRFKPNSINNTFGVKGLNTQFKGGGDQIRFKEGQFCFIDYAKAFDCVDHNILWKILKEMGIPDHLTYLLRNLYAGQEAVVRHGRTDWFKIGKGI